MGKGLYTYDIAVDGAFLASFAESPYQRGDIALHLTVDKRSRDMVVDFDFMGTIGTSCDRCLADIGLPIADKRQLILKFSADVEEQRDEGDIVYLHPETNEFNLGPYVYEMVVLSVPMIRTYDCREGEPPYPCDEDLLRRIDDSYESATDAPERGPVSDDDDRPPSPWDVLKDLNNN